MLSLLKQWWWKILCVVILTYVLLGGMLVPLAAGITHIIPAEFTAEKETLFSLQLANAHLQTGGHLQVWVKNGNNYWKPQEVHVLNENEMTMRLNFPYSEQKNLRSNFFDIVVNNDVDGTFSLRDALVFHPLDSTLAAANYKTASLVIDTPNVLYNKNRYFAFPYREILYQSIRNTFYHVPMWFGMMLILIFSLIYSVLYLRSGNPLHDLLAAEAVNVALLYGVLGLLTGMMWANYTWGEPWPNDPKLNGAAVGVMIYLAYGILRGSMDDVVKRARISAVYNIFALVFFVAFIFIIPRLTDSLHPGNGGNPAFSKYDLDSHMRMFFYPAVIGWSLLAFWIVSLRVRIKLLEEDL